MWFHMTSVCPRRGSCLSWQYSMHVSGISFIFYLQDLSHHFYLQTYRVLDPLIWDLIWHCTWPNDPFHRKGGISGDTKPQDLLIILFTALPKSFQHERMMEWHFKRIPEAIIQRCFCVSVECYPSGKTKLITILCW